MGIFYWLSYVRGKRIFHPEGDVWSGILTITPSNNLPRCALFSKPTSYPILARLSRGIGLPKQLPDILGFALRIQDVYGTGKHQDFLTLTCGSGMLTRYVPLFRYIFEKSFFSAILPYEIDAKKYIFGIRPSGKSYTLLIASPFGIWNKVGDIALDTKLPPEAIRQLADKLNYNPWNTGGGIVPHGFLNHLRKHAYPDSQAGRRARSLQ